MKVQVLLTGLGQELHLARRFETANTPTASQFGFGAIAAAATMEAIPMGQIAASLIDAMYIKSIDNTVYISPITTVSTAALLKLDAGEATIFRPYNGAAVLSVGITCSTAGAQYEYCIIGQGS